jgi:predicted unusual protein kinase regulating ubiquinone biosynthesis (AarF/ABC1/UbiB family)
MSWLPAAFKDLLQHVPTLLFDVVSWGALTKDATLLSTRLLTGSGADEARKTVANTLPQGVKFTRNEPQMPTGSVARRMVGEKILEIYFDQITRPAPMFLDLRLNRFGVEENQIVWNPSSLWGEFSPDFVKGLKDLYAGFYGQDDQLFQLGLLKSGLVSNEWSIADKEKMAHLFRAHFGSALDEPMAFRLKSFQQSFQAVFAFLLEKKVKLTTDFLLLGVMLVTLYLALEELGDEYPVAKIYHQSQID